MFRVPTNVRIIFQKRLCKVTASFAEYAISTEKIRKIFVVFIAIFFMKNIGCNV